MRQSNGRYGGGNPQPPCDCPLLAHFQACSSPSPAPPPANIRPSLPPALAPLQASPSPPFLSTLRLPSPAASTPTTVCQDISLTQDLVHRRQRPACLHPSKLPRRNFSPPYPRPPSKSPACLHHSKIPRRNSSPTSPRPPLRACHPFPPSQRPFPPTHVSCTIAARAS